MPDRLPISTEKSPNAILEVVLRLKIKDAMTRNVFTLGRLASLREVQTLMKRHGISSVPICDEKRLVGLVSVDDIMTALDRGHIEEKAEQHMTRSLVLLEDDMPLSFAISYFNKYSYGRFPVINKEKDLVGMISSRDVLLALLEELNKEIRELENKVRNEKVDLPNHLCREFFIKKFDFENAGQASFELKKMLKERSIPQKIIRRASIASYELEINVAIHSNGGRVRYILDDEKLEIITLDEGPGIEDVELVLTEGYSTANEWIRSLGFGAGMGLPNAKRVSDEFVIESELGKGTQVKSTILLREEPYEGS